MKFAPIPIASGQVIDVSQAFRFSLQTTFAGSPTGTLNIQVSNDPLTPTNWANAQAQVSVTTNGSTLYPYPDTPAKWFRFVYAGTGTLVANLFTQGV